MPSQYKYYSGFVVKYVGAILKLQTKEDGFLFLFLGPLMMILPGWEILMDTTISWGTVIFGLVGLGILLWGLQLYFTTWTFNRSNGLLVYQRPGLPEKHYSLDKIIGVHLDSVQRRRRIYRVVLEMSNSEWVPLSKYGSFDPQIEARIAICEFLGMGED